MTWVTSVVIDGVPVALKITRRQVLPMYPHDEQRVRDADIILGRHMGKPFAITVFSSSGPSRTRRFRRVGWFQ